MLTMSSEDEVLQYVQARLAETWYEHSAILVRSHVYTYLIEAWEAICLEEYVDEESGDWDDDEYLYDLTYYLHNCLVDTDFRTPFPSCEIVNSELVEGAQFGVSVIVGKILASEFEARLAFGKR